MSRLLSRSHTFAIIVILDLKIHQSMWIQWPFFPKTWTKGHWPLDDLWPHVYWGHMCDSTQGSLCPSPMTLRQCMWIEWSILQNTTYTYIHTHTTYRMSDHIVSCWTQFRRDKKNDGNFHGCNRFFQKTIVVILAEKCVWPQNDHDKCLNNPISLLFTIESAPSKRSTQQARCSHWICVTLKQS